MQGMEKGGGKTKYKIVNTKNQNAEYQKIEYIMIPIPKAVKLFAI